MSLDEEKDVWRLRNTIKEKDQLISDIKLKVFELQKKYANDIQNLIREKMEISLELKSLKPSIEKKDEFIEKYSKESLDKIKELQDKLALVEKDWEIKYQALENKYNGMETKHLDEIEEKKREIERLKKSTEELQKKLVEEKTKSQELINIKAKLDEHERDDFLKLKTDPGKIKELKEVLEKKDQEIYELKEKLSDASVKLKEYNGVGSSVPDLNVRSLQMKISELEAHIKSLQSEMAFYQEKKIQTIFFGEKQAIVCMNQIIKDTKRSLLLFIPKFQQLEQLDLLSLPSRIIIEVATSLNLKDKDQVIAIDRYKDNENIKLKNYSAADMYAILADNSTLFLGFLDESKIPVGFKTTSPNIISFLSGLLKDSFLRFAEKLKI